MCPLSSTCTTRVHFPHLGQRWLEQIAVWRWENHAWDPWLKDTSGGQLLHAQFAGSTITPLTALHLMGEMRIGWRPIFSKGRERLYPPFWSLRSPLLGPPSEALKPPSQPMANPHGSTHDMASNFRLDKDSNRDPTTFPDCSNLSSVPRATKIRSFLLPLAF